MTESFKNPMGGINAPRRGLLGLWSPARAKKRDSVDEILERLHGQAAVYRRTIVRHINERHVDDVWGEALLKITRILKEGREVKNPEAYMHTVCVTCTVDELRKIAKRSEKLIGDDDASELDDKAAVLHPESGLTYWEVKPVLDDVLTTRDHQAFVLSNLFGFSGKEIAVALDWNHASVRQALTRVKRILESPDVARRLSYWPRRVED